jgi:hypothetical protein
MKEYPTMNKILRQIKEYFPLIVSVVVMTVIAFVAMPALAGNHDDHNRNEGSGSKTAPPMKQTQAQVQKWPGFFDCGPTPEILGLIKHNNEKPMMESIGIIQIPPEQQGGQIRMMQAPITQYFNAETGTYTVVADFNNGYSCILLFGHGLKPAGSVTTKVPKKSPDFWKDKITVPKIVDPKDVDQINDDQKFRLT